MKPPGNHQNNVEDHNRLIVALILSLMVMGGWQFFFTKPAPEQEAAVKAQQLAAAIANAEPIRPREAVLADSKRIPVNGRMVTGSLALKGLRLDDLRLAGQTVSADSDELVPLFNPSGAPYAFYEESGWLSDDKNIKLPSQDTVWTLAPGSPSSVESGKPPVKMTWDNGQGLMFARQISLDDDYLFTVAQSFSNKTGGAVTLNPYHLTARTGLPPDFRGLYTLHEGPVSCLDGKCGEMSYKSLTKGEKVDKKSTRGWTAITDKYWMAAILPAPDQAFDARIVGTADAKGVQHFQADIVDAPLTAQAGASAENKTYIYAGVKKLDVMNAYGKQYGFQRLDYGIDFGIWYIITKPFYILFHLLVKLVGNVGLSILTMTVVVRGALFPIAARAYTAMAKMKKIQPELKELQAKYATDKATLQQKIFELYARENANPFSGCWPMLVQIPIFFALYKTILISIELRHAPFWGWIPDLSAPDPTTVFNLFGLVPWQPPQALMIGGWAVLFCGTMIVQKRLQPPMPDEVQEKMQSYFPFFITFMMAHFPSGLVIYWTWSNVLAILQQYYILKKVGGEDVSLIRGHHTRRKPKKKKNG